MESGLGRAVEYCLKKRGQALHPALDASLKWAVVREPAFALDGLWASAKSRQLGRRRPCAGRLCVRFSAEDEGCIGSTEAERIGHRVLGGHCKGLITYDFETARVIDLAQVRRWWSDLVSQRENR
jgi:hypothetical protein